jgi:hypothetical protein
MNKPHKHAELIKAWADGAEIQANEGNGWISCGGCPAWNENTEYRIKPEEKKPVERWLWTDNTGDMSVSLYTEHEIKIVSPKRNIKLEWSRTEFQE